MDPTHGAPVSQGHQGDPATEDQAGCSGTAQHGGIRGGRARRSDPKQHGGEESDAGNQTEAIGHGSPSRLDG
jgi:hypothetical protein